MGAGPALMAVGTGLSIYGNYQANQKQSQLEAQNASYYGAQADEITDATNREVNIYKRQNAVMFGDQVSAFAKGGVDLSGSALNVLADTKLKGIQEEGAIQEEGTLREGLARARQKESQDKADTLGSFGYSALQSSGALLNTAGNIASREN